MKYASKFISRFFCLLKVKKLKGIKIAWARNENLTLIISKLFTLFFPVITIPLVINQFGSSQFGIYAATTSFLTLFSLLDFGYSSILHSSIPKFNTFEEKKVFYHEVLLKQCSVLIIPFGILISTKIFIDLNKNSFTDIFLQFSTAAIPAIVGYLLYLIGNITFRMLIASANLVKASIILFIGNLLTFIYVVIVCLYFRKLDLLCFGTFGIQGITNITYHFAFLTRNLKSVKVSIDWKAKRKNQYQLLFIQATYIVGFQLDSLMVAQILGVENVSEYAIYQKIYSIPVAIFSIYFMSTWTKSAQGVQHFRQPSFMSTVSIYLLISLLMALTVVIFMPFLSASLYKFDIWLYLAFQLYLIAMFATSPIINFINGQEEWDWILRSVSVGLAINLLLSILGLKLLQWSGSAAVASAIALFFSIWIPFKYSSIRFGAKR